MVTAAAADNASRYTVIGVPLDSGDDQAIADFISGRNVHSIVHLDESSSLWRLFRANSLPSWATITAGGTVETGGGSLPQRVIDGSWADA